MRYLGRDRGVYVKYTTGTECSCLEAPSIKRWRIDEDIRLQLSTAPPHQDLTVPV